MYGRAGAARIRKTKRSFAVGDLPIQLPLFLIAIV